MNNAYKLPDSYAKHKSSNNYKLLNINEQAITALKSDISDVLNVLDIQQATGKTLDLYGDMLGVKRGEMNDIQYRYMILTQAGINVTQSDYNSIIEIMLKVFNCTPADIILGESETEPCRVVLVKFPMAILTAAGFSDTQAIAMIERLLPIGVTIDGSNFEGTFEFAETYGEYDESKGFGDIEQTIGGYLGLLVAVTTE